MDNINETTDASKGIATLAEVKTGEGKTSGGQFDSSKAENAAAEISAAQNQPARDRTEPQGDPTVGAPTLKNMMDMMARMTEFETAVVAISADRESLRESLAKTQAALADLASVIGDR